MQSTYCTSCSHNQIVSRYMRSSEMLIYSSFISYFPGNEGVTCLHRMENAYYQLWLAQLRPSAIESPMTSWYGNVFRVAGLREGLKRKPVDSAYKGSFIRSVNIFLLLVWEEAVERTSVFRQLDTHTCKCKWLMMVWYTATMWIRGLAHKRPLVAIEHHRTWSTLLQ